MNDVINMLSNLLLHNGMQYMYIVANNMYGNKCILNVMSTSTTQQICLQSLISGYIYLTYIIGYGVGSIENILMHFV